MKTPPSADTSEDLHEFLTRPVRRFLHKLTSSCRTMPRLCGPARGAQALASTPSLNCKNSVGSRSTDISVAVDRVELTPFSTSVSLISTQRDTNVFRRHVSSTDATAVISAYFSAPQLPVTAIRSAYLTRIK